MKVRKLNKANFETDFTTKKKGSLVDIKITRQLPL